MELRIRRITRWSMCVITLFFVVLFIMTEQMDVYGSLVLDSTVNKATYWVDYDANEGTGAPESQVKVSGVVLRLSSSRPSRKGYTFQGWSAGGPSGEVTYQPGDSYTEDSNITLYAVWSLNPGDVSVDDSSASGSSSEGKKRVPTISAKSKTVTYKSKAFNLNAKVTGNGKLTYSSSNKKVATVDKNGKVKIIGYGKTAITIKSQETAKYKAATKRISITVKPKQPNIILTSLGGEQLQVNWTKDTSVTEYQVQACDRADFKTGAFQRKFGRTLSSVKIPLSGHRGEVYYVRVRAYKKVGNKTYYSAWSKVKNATVK